MRKGIGQYRGKSVKTDKWVIGNLVCPLTHAVKICRQEAIDGSITGVEHDVYPETVGECSGQGDKYGVPMYEKDIVLGLSYFSRPILAEVAFSGGAFGLKWNRGGVIEFTPFPSICNVEYEVVGNTVDNPEMMEATNNDM